MLAKLKSLFSQDSGNQQIALAEANIRLASAALMVEVATIDRHFDEAESTTLVQALKAQFELSNEDALELVDLAENARNDATSLHEFTKQINASCDALAKFELIKGMWEVAFADGHLDKYEEHIIRRACDLIHLSHSDFIRAKLAVKK